MGLCKCPKRRVTNQFCFEHRVNVCEHCMISNHTKCIVQSYIQWLQDSDYNPICELCSKSLGNHECVRLICYHVYHWSCLESTFRKLPRTTAPAGYQCPMCRSQLFPPPNLVSPVADVLREKLASVNWARSGLGLSLLSDDGNGSSISMSHDNSGNHYGANDYSMSGNLSGFSGNDSLERSSPHRVTPIGASDDESSTRVSNGPPYSIVQVQDDHYESSSYENNYGQVNRKLFEAADQNRNSSRFDNDDDKYKRKSPTEWILRWWKNTLPPARKRKTTGNINRRNMMAIIIVCIIVVSLIMILMKIGRASIENDPSFNVNNNPNIHFQADA